MLCNLNRGRIHGTKSEILRYLNKNGEEQNGSEKNLVLKVNGIARSVQFYVNIIG
jgi:hypothetical protein